VCKQSEPNNATISSYGIVDGTSPNHAASPLDVKPNGDGIESAIALVNLLSVWHAEFNGAACENCVDYTAIDIPSANYR